MVTVMSVLRSGIGAAGFSATGLRASPVTVIWAAFAAPGARAATAMASTAPRTTFPFM